MALVLAGALAGGFVNGLTGFGTGLTAIGIWLYALPPTVAASLVILTSFISQLQALPLIWKRVDWGRALPFVIPGLLGVPVGAAILFLVDARTFKLCVGGFLVLYSAVALLRPKRTGLAWGGRPADASIGLLGGLLGGLAGLSGPMMAMWTDLRGDDKQARRSLLQVFNLSILTAALAGHASAGYLTQAVWWALLAALPGTILGAWLGVRVYSRLGDRGYQRIVLVMLMLSGLGLLLTLN